MWLLRLIIREDRPLARARKRLNVRTPSTMKVDTFNSCHDYRPCLGQRVLPVEDCEDLGTTGSDGDGVFEVGG